jgi:hypothetical protein
MKYQDCVEAMQDEAADAGAPRLADANINPATGLATDYLNHFNEAVMLLEMMPDAPECLDDFLGWRPMSYREHFVASHFKGRDMAIAAYDAADPVLRESLDALAATMTAVLEAAHAALSGGMPRETAGVIAERAAAWVRPLVARAGAVINGDAQAGVVRDLAPQAVVDGLMTR